MKLTDLLKNILSEAKPKKPSKGSTNRGREEGPIRPQVREGIENSIKHRWLLFIDYQGDEETQPFKRWCEPYVLGIRKETGNLTLRCYVYKGASVSKRMPDWKTVRLDRIGNLAPLTAATFNTPRPKYNATGDKQMSSILMRVKFDESGNKDDGDNNGPDAPIDINSPEIKKTAEILRKNTQDGKVDFDHLEKAPEFKESGMKRALNVIKRMLARAGKGIIKGLQNLNIKEDEIN